MDKEAILELQKIDCNCNDCFFMERNIAKFRQYDSLYEGQKKASHRINYGYCKRYGKDISFIPGNCQIETQSCFIHRRDGKDH